MKRLIKQLGKWFLIWNIISFAVAAVAVSTVAIKRPDLILKYTGMEKYYDRRNQNR